MAGRYVLNVNGVIQLNKASLNKMTKDLNRAFRDPDEFTNKTQQALSQVNRAIDRVRANSALLGKDIAKSLTARFAGLKNTLNSTNENKFDKFKLKIKELTQALREAERAAKDLNDAEARAVRNRRRFGDLRENVGLNRRRAVAALRNLRGDISGSGLSQLAQDALLDKVDKAGGLTKNRRNRTRLNREVIPNLRRELKERRTAEKKEIDRNTRAAAITRDRRNVQDKNNNLQNQVREKIRSVTEAVQKSNIPVQQQTPLLNKLLGLDSLTGSKAGRKQVKEALNQIKRDHEDIRKATEDAQKKTDDINRANRKRSKQQDARTEKQENAQGNLRKLSDRIQKSNIPFADQTRLLSGFGAADARTNSKAGRKDVRKFIEDTKREADELIKVQNEADRKQKEADQKRNRAKKARLKREREANEGGAFGFGKQSALAFRRFGAFTIAAGALFEVQQAFRGAIAEAIVFQDQMVKIGQVNGSSASSIQKFSETITKLSASTGVASAELANSAVTIAQAGFSLEDTGKVLGTLAKTQLSPSFNDLDNTTETVIALRTQFNLAAGDFESTFGSINAVSKAFAVEAEDIATAIRKTGGAFNVAGGSINELIALFTAVRATTRESADTIAVGFRTIFGRLQRPAIIQDLKKFNIDLQDAGGNFVKPFEAIRRLNQALSAIPTGDSQFARIVEQVGGIRQISKVVPLIQQFGLAQTALNIAKLGTNSLDKDAERRQQSLQVQLNKTKETFLGFVRSLGENNNAVGKTFLTLNGYVQDLLGSLSGLSGFATPLATILSVGALKTAGGFASGFASNINPFGGFKRSPIGRGASALSVFGNQNRTFGQKFAIANKRLGGSLPAIGAIAGAGLAFGAGAALTPNGPITSRNRNRFIGGSSITGAATGLAVGATLGGTVGGLPGAAAGAGIGAVVGAIIEFDNAVKLAAQQMQEVNFRLGFDRFFKSLEFINAGKLSPLGQGGNLKTTIASIQERRFTATGDFRTELEGQTGQLIEKLVIFNQRLAENVSSMQEFNAAGGDASIAFLELNSVLSKSELEQQVNDIIIARQNELRAMQVATAANEQLLSQANLITAFSAALQDAVDASERLAAGFDFAAGTFGSQTGFTFTGRAGFNNVFDRPGKVGNVAQFGAASSQLEGLLGGAIPGLASTNTATSNIFQQLPGILSDFALARPTGNIDDTIDKFIRQKLEIAGAGAPKGAVQPVIDAIVAAVSTEAGGEGGQGKLVDKILENTVEFTEELISKSGADVGRKFQQEAANALIDRFNRFAGQLAEVTDREIDLRNQIAENIVNFANSSAEIAALRDPQGTLRPDIAQAGLLNAGKGLLNPFGAGRVAGNVDLILARRRAVRNTALGLESQIQKADTPQKFADLAKQLGKTQEELGALDKALELATDTSARRAGIEQQLSKAQQARQQITGGFGEFVFGNKQQRNDLNLGAVLAQIVGKGGPAAFKQIANFPGDQNRELPGVLDNFLQRFSNVDIRGIGNLGELRRNIIEEELFPEFQKIVAQQFDPRDRAANKNVIDAEARKAAKQGADNAVLDKEQKFLDALAALNKLDFENRKKILEDIQKQNEFLTKTLGQSLDTFIKELRNNVLIQQKTGAETKFAGLQTDNLANLQKITDFIQVTNIGGFKDNTQNKTALEFAKQIRDVGVSPDTVALGQLEEKLQNTRGTFSNDNLGLISAVNQDPLLKKFSDQLRAGGRNPRESDVRTASTNLATDLAGTFAIKDVQALQRTTEALVAEFQASQGTLRPQQTGDLLTDIVSAAANQAREQENRQRQQRAEVQANLDAAGPQMAGFAKALAALPVADFDRFSNLITGLGALKIDELITKFHAMNAEMGIALQAIQDINAKIQQNQNAPPIALNNPNLNLDAFGEASRGLVAALNNFPKNVELAANHKIEVTFNGAQVLASLLPSLQELVANGTNEAIAKFAKDNFPGGRALS